MGPLSAYEVEQICESAYYHAVSRFNYNSDADFCALFMQRADNDFTDFANPRLNYRAPENIRHISHKWRNKLAIDAERWYEENVEGERKRESAQREQAKRDREREEKEHAEEQAQRRREREERERREREERERREAEERKRREEERKRREEEEARLKAEAEAKRKAQNEVNRKKLAEIQAQWEAQRNPQTATVADDKVACPHCGNSVSKTSKFCTSCGTRLLVVCPNCGANVKATSKFCTSCGTPLTNNV